MALATLTDAGEIKLAGDLAGSPDANTPTLTSTGIAPGTYMLPSITVNAKGLIVGITADAGTIPLATTTTRGLVQIGNGLNVSVGVVSLAPATTSTIGGVRVGTGLNVNSTGVLSIPTATTSSVGIFSVGSGLSISGAGVLSTNIPNASTSVKGLVQVGSNINVTGDGTISVPAATNTTLGVVRPDGTGDITVNPSGQLVLTTSRFARNDIINVFTAPQRFAPYALTDGATISVDLSQSNTYTITLGGNRTVAAPTSLASGVYKMLIKQDGVGNRTLTWNSVYKWSTTPVMSTAANSTDIVTLTVVDTAVYASLQKGFV